MNKLSIALRASLDGYKYVLDSGPWAELMFFNDLDDAESEMMKLKPGTASVKSIEKYVSDASDAPDGVILKK